MPDAVAAERNLQVELVRGRLDLEFEATQWSPDALFDIAERRNPKRAFLFVSKVLGRHIPASPASMRAAFAGLAAQVPADLPGPVLVIGMAETAVGLGAGVHQSLLHRYPDAVYWTTTRHPLGTPVLARFEEEHSHATSHLLHQPLDPALLHHILTARSLVLVDDEATTGRTFVNLVRALETAGLNHIERIVAATLTDWSDGAVGAALGSRATAVSLMAGRWHWQPDPDAPPVDMPPVTVTARGTWTPDLSRDWGRLGVTGHVNTLRHKVTVSPGERVLVLGSSEFVWRPFMLAEALAEAGALVDFAATTRSPIAVGQVITDARAFSDNYGLGIPNFMYNVLPGTYDRILLCVETRPDMVDPALCEALPLEIVVDEP
ncbi:MAG: phosphoribosyltransferase domain-containing protein [Candidatus Sericytochromatia bacterium]|nr:phosphoribosyltransferase domain-containing protein [Candidatus Sericytochromatia bacterium]